MAITHERNKGSMLVELLVAIGLAALLFPALATSFITSLNGKAQQGQRLQAVTLMKETEEAVRSVKNYGWTNFAVNGTFHPLISGSKWSLASGSATTNGFTQQVVVSDVYRNASGALAASGTIDPSTKMITTTISWTQPYATSVSSVQYLTRNSNLSFTQTTGADFSATSGATLTNTQVTTTSGGEVKLANNNKGKWCSPSFSNTTISLPDGPPVAVIATASATSINVPNDVFVATAPYATSSVKLAYVNVTANTATPAASLRGIFTLDPSQYSAGTYPVSLDGLSNSFATTDVKYYTSSGGNLYALMTTTDPNHEVVVAKMKNNGTDTYQDPVNKIYQYWTYFNTKMYGSDSYSSPSANAPDSGGDGDGFQTNPANAYIQDSTYAVDSNSGNGTSTSCTGADKDKHRFYDYGFSLPSGATVNGVAVNLYAKVDSTTGSPKMCVQFSWDGGTTWSTTESTATLTTSNAAYTLGGSSDTWGRTWGSTDFSDTNFRMRIIDVASSTSRSFSLDYAGVKVYYNGISTTANDEAPFAYGAIGLTLVNNTGYIDSGGYLYGFDLSNIDSKSVTNGLDQIGCRILLDGYDCKPNSGTDQKYASGQTGESWSDTAAPAHNDCSDGGNIELDADHQLSAVQPDAMHKYVYVAVGAGTNPELDIVDVSTPPTANLTSNTCGRGSDTGWKVTGTLDFDPANGTEEAANSVYAKSDGTRAYMSSNGGIIHSGIPDSDQFYIIDTTNKSSPQFLSTWPSTVAGQHYVNTAETGYYNGNATNIELYPRRALTVQNGARAILVGQDGIPNDGIEPQEYQVLDLTSESAPAYCGGLNFSAGFNDLTSVTEANGDNYVYMVANTPDKQLKVIQGGPDNAIYTASGTYESSTFDANTNGGSTLSAFNSFLANISAPSATTISAQVAVAPAVSGSCANVSPFPFVGPDGTTSTFFMTNAATLSGTIPFGKYLTNAYQNPGQCFRYKTWMSSTDQTQTPILYDMRWNYSP